jgi:hypothetical protein
MSRMEWAILAASGLAVAGLIGDAVLKDLRREAREPEYRAQLLQATAGIKPCMPSTEAARVIQEPSGELRIAGDENRGWSLTTPLRLGAKNWIALIEVADARVQYVRFRTEDSLTEHPVDAPADQGPCREVAYGQASDAAEQ